MKKMFGKKAWRGIEDEALVSSEEKMLLNTGLPLEAFEITDVPVNYYGENTIHTI